MGEAEISPSALKQATAQDWGTLLTVADWSLLPAQFWRCKVAASTALTLWHDADLVASDDALLSVVLRMMEGDDRALLLKRAEDVVGKQRFDRLLTALL